MLLNHKHAGLVCDKLFYLAKNRFDRYNRIPPWRKCNSLSCKVRAINKKD